MARVVKSSRLFKNNFLESLTHVHPLTPLVFWTPVIAYLLYRSSVSPLAFVGLALSGFLTWTLSEYIMHRVVFHYEAKSKFGKFIIFLFHGIHHDEPDDATRLVMPPFPAIVIASVFFQVFYFFLGFEKTLPFFAFFMIGYLCYDYIHYGVHHFPCKNRVMKYLKRYHMLHHHQGTNTRYGVSSPLWDLILGTYPKNKTSEAATN